MVYIIVYNIYALLSYINRTKLDIWIDLQWFFSFISVFIRQKCVTLWDELKKIIAYGIDVVRRHII